MTSRSVRAAAIAGAMLACAPWVVAARSRASEPATDPPAGAERGVGAREHPLPLPTTMTHIEYQEILIPFIRSRDYAADLGWSVDKRVRDTGAYIKGVSYGTHPAVRCYYSPKVMYWLTGDPDFWPEGRDAGLAPRKRPREGAIPDGGMIVKEMLPPPARRYEGLDDAALEKLLRLPSAPGWDVMIKDAAGAPSGWFWASVWEGQKPDTPASFDYPQAGFVLACVRCHSVAEEGGTFSSLRNIAGFPGDPLQFFVDDSWRDIPAAQQPFAFSHPPEQPQLRAPRGPGPARLNSEFLHCFAAEHVGYPDVRRFPPESNDHVPAHATTPRRHLVSGQCMMCHSGANSKHAVGPIMFLETERGALNVSPYGEWRWSPMGLAGRDPVFHAQLESELSQLEAELPADRARLVGEQVVNTCLRCHGAMGKRQFDHDVGVGHEYWHPRASFSREWFHLADQKHPLHAYGALARDGVSCTVCHGMVEEYKDLGDFLANSITGQYKVGPATEIYGPFADVIQKPMQTTLGVTPRADPFITSSRMCASCHVIDLPVVDRPLDHPAVAELMPRDHLAQLLASEKNPAFQGFVHRIEQATYLEWLNSKYQDEFGRTTESRSCQDCHMPRGYESPDGAVSIPQIQTKIATIQDQDYPEADHRIPVRDQTVTFRQEGYRRHTFQGANVFLVEMFRQFPDVLGVRTKDYETGVEGIHFAIENYVQNARRNTATLELLDVETAGQTVAADVKITNLTGHRLPSGVGFRRLWIEFLVLDTSTGQERIVWASGLANGAGVILGADGRILPTEFFAAAEREGGPASAHQPHHRVIIDQNQVQIYEELSKDGRGRFTTSFLHRVEDVKDNRLLPIGWSKAGPDAAMPAAFVAATHPHGVGDDPQYEDGQGTDIVSYRITLPDCFDCTKLRIRATLYSQAFAPYYLRDRFADIPAGPAGEARRRLFHIMSHLETEGTVIEGWRFKIATDEAEITEDHRAPVVKEKHCG